MANIGETNSEEFCDTSPGEMTDKLTVSCGCGQQYRIGVEYAGQSLPCPVCQRTVVVPATTSIHEKVVVPCSCGQSFRAPANLVGQQHPCPSCQTLLTIGGPSPQVAAQISQPMPSTEMRQRCPTCEAPCRFDAVLCVNCGYHFHAGRNLGTKQNGDDLLATAEREAEADKATMHESDGAPWFVYAGGIGMLLLFILCMMVLGNQFAVMMGFVIMAASFLGILTGFVLLFIESPSSALWILAILFIGSFRMLAFMSMGGADLIEDDALGAVIMKYSIFAFLFGAMNTVMGMVVLASQGTP